MGRPPPAVKSEPRGPDPSGGSRGRVDTEPKGFSVAAVLGRTGWYFMGPRLHCSIVNNNGFCGRSPPDPPQRGFGFIENAIRKQWIAVLSASEQCDAQSPTHL